MAAGGLGINLYTADIVVLFDSDWYASIPQSLRPENAHSSPPSVCTSTPTATAIAAHPQKRNSIALDATLV